MATAQPSLTIGALARTCDVSTPTIRYYEQIGLLPPAQRNAGGQRRYVKTDVARLTFIRRCRDFGFSIDHVRILSGVPEGTLSGCQASRDIAQGRVTEIRSKIQDLLALETDLHALIATCDAVCGTHTDRTCEAFRSLHIPS